MISLVSVPTADAYPTAPSSSVAWLAEQIGDSNGGYAFLSGDAIAQILYGDVSNNDWSNEFLAPKGGLDLDPGVAAIRFRSKVPGTPVTVSAALFREDEPAVRLSAGGLTNLSLTFQQNGVTKAFEPILNFVDTANETVWTLTDNSAAQTLSVSLAFANPAVFPGTVQATAVGVNTAPGAAGTLTAAAIGVNTAAGAAGTLTLSGRIFSGAGGTGGIWVDSGTQFVGSQDATHFGFFDGSWWLLTDSSGNTTILGTFGFRTGVGNGASYTQLTSLTTSVAVTTIVGQINTFTSALAGGLNVSFNVTTPAGMVTSTDQVIVSWSNNPWSGNIPIWVTGIFGNSFTIAYTNLGALTSSQTGRINYTIIKGGGANS